MQYEDLHAFGRAGIARLMASPIGPRVVLAPDEASGGSSEGDAGGGDGVTPPPAGDAGDSNAAGAPKGQASGGADGSLSAYRPDGLPDHLVGETDQQTIDRLYEAYSGARKAISKGDMGTVPESADGYSLQFSESVMEAIGNPEEDALLMRVRDEAHKHGLTDKQFSGFLDSVMTAMLDDGLVEPQINYDKEIASLVPENAGELDEAGRKAAVEARIRDNEAMLTTWQERGMPEEAANELRALLDTAAGNHAIEYFTRALQSRQPQPGGGGNGGAVSEQELKQRERDPRNRFGNSQYDPAFADETRRLYQRVYGDEPRGA